MFVILLLVVGVAAFNIVSTLVMIVKEKEGDIAILRTVGATPRAIMRVFIVQGGLIGVLGTAGGLALGAAIATNLQSLIEGLESIVHTHFLDPSVYYLSELPAQLQALDLIRICGTALVLSFVSTLYPPGVPRARSRPRCFAMNDRDPGGTDSAVLLCRGVTRHFREGPARIEVLKGIDLAIARSERLAIVGASGAGKSTLLQLMGGLDEPTAGTVHILGEDVNKLDEVARGRLRNRAVGFVYQFHHLLPEFTALENVAMPLLVMRAPTALARERATKLLDRVGLGERLTHKPGELSGGERQRAAVARALITNPALVLATSRPAISTSGRATGYSS
jgi:lipoprotein-releasing system ATP-binding protein